MDDDLRSKIDETFRLAKENNKILHSVQNHARWAAVMRFAYWLVILGIGIGSFYFIQPYIEQAMNLYSSFKNTEQKIQDLPKSFNVKALFDVNKN